MPAEAFQNSMTNNTVLRQSDCRKFLGDNYKENVILLLSHCFFFYLVAGFQRL